MSINEISTNKNTKAKYYTKVAIHGGVGTAVLLSLSTAADTFIRPERTKEIIKQLGGKGNYIKNLAANLAIFTVIGAAANILTNAIINKVTEKRN